MSKQCNPAIGICGAIVAVLAAAILVLVAVGVLSDAGMSGSAYLDHQQDPHGSFRLEFGASYSVILGTLLFAGLLAALGSLVKARRARV
ncbi:hypothetical protein ACIQTZ_22995 [Paenarthrobacter sp. NPDC090520]|uniref:hypothetical protein n=1 Tax=unclassified Paenarthrobacter TaxID=2634190 RepID=UPI00381476B3